MTDSISEGRKIIFVDEVLFTRSSQLKADYSRRGENMLIILKGSTGGYMSVIAGISHQQGIERYHLQHDAVDENDFCQYIRDIRNLPGHNKLALFLDNLSVHHTDQVINLCIDLDIRLIFNVVRSPDFNPIETVFSVVKNHYKRARQSHEVN